VLLLYGALILSSVLSVWWKGPRAWLIGIAFGLCVMAVAIGRQIPPVWKGTIGQVGGASGSIYEARWLQDSCGMAWLAYEGGKPSDQPSWKSGDSNRTASPSACVLHIARLGQQEHKVALPGPAFRWSLFPSLTDTKITLMLDTSSNTSRSLLQIHGHEIYTYDTVEGLRRFGRLPHDAWLLLPRKWGPLVWSPDGQYVLVIRPTQGQKGLRLTVVHVDTGATTNVEDALGEPVRWTNNQELLLVRRQIAVEGAGAQRRITEQKILFLSVDASNGRKTLIREYPIAPNYIGLPIRGSEYVMIYPDESVEGTSRTSSLSFLNLSTGNRIELPGIDRQATVFSDDYDWNGPRHRFAYIAKPDVTGGRRRLVAADVDRGVIASVEFPADNKFGGLRLSPDGKQLFFYRRRTRGLVVGGLSRAEIWNTETGEVTTVRILGAIETVICSCAVMGFEKPFALPLWSPDGRYVAYSALRYSNKRDVFAIEAADWGGWLASRK